MNEHDNHSVMIDAIVGPTHHHGGLATGNLASEHHAGAVAHPRNAALQGLAKMRLVAELGVPQFVLPPQIRPLAPTSQSIDASLIADLGASHAQQVSALAASSAMWTANAATVSPAADTADNCTHLTVANLAWHHHRSLEAPQTLTALQQLCCDPAIIIHQPLPAELTDEGAANHLRLSPTEHDLGIEVFVYGVERPETHSPARQDRRASAAIADRHRLDPGLCIFAEQTPTAINAGVFHNDVIALSHLDLLVIHEHAWMDQRYRLTNLQRTYQALHGHNLTIIEVSDTELPLDQAVSSYFFNAELLTTGDGSWAIILPEQCRGHTGIDAILARCQSAETRLQHIHYCDVGGSMANGGGPACLRLRLPIPAEAELLPSARWTPELHDRLTNYITTHYPDTIDLDSIIAEAIRWRSISRDVWKLLGYTPPL